MWRDTLGDVALVAGSVVAVSGALAAVAGLMIKTVRSVRALLRGTGEFLDDWRGEPGRDGVPQRLGVMHRLADIEAGQAAAAARLDRIEREVRPNGGSSLRDAVDRIERRTGARDEG